jgi:ssDNA-binding replication factor A large subunit
MYSRERGRTATLKRDWGYHLSEFMGAIEDVYEDLDAEVSLDAFRDAVEAKIEQMGGLADEETAAMLVAHEVADGEVEGIAAIDPGMEEAKFVAKVTSIGELRSFERDDPEADDGQVLNADVADETAQIRVTFWDEQASAAVEELSVGDVLRIAGRPGDGYSGVEVSVDRVEEAPDEEIDVQLEGASDISDLSLGMSGVSVRGRVLGTDPVREFERDDGSTGQVANLLVGDETGRVRVTLWDDSTTLAETLGPGDAVEVLDGYVRERDGDLELHCNDRSAIETLDGPIEYEPSATSIASLELGERTDVAGVVRSADPKRTFDRDDGSEGQVRNVTVQDESGTVRIVMWGEKADMDVGPGDEVLFVDVDVQEGWQDDVECSAGWRSTVVPLDDGETTAVDTESEPSPDTTDHGSASLDAFAVEDGPEMADGPEAEQESGDEVEFTGVVVQAGDPVILDDGQRTVTVESDLNVERGETVTLSGQLSEGQLIPDDTL